jgi:hypothetical protein
VCSKSSPPDLDALYASAMQSWHDAAEKIPAAWLIGEYEFPNKAIDFPPTDLQFPAWSVASGRASATALDYYGRGWFRPWYLHNDYWGVLDEQGGEHTDKTDILSRPYPRRVAGHPSTPGTVGGWEYDFVAKVLALTIEPGEGVTAPTEVFVPAARHYPGGFVLTLDDQTYVSDPAAPDGLTPPGAKASFDFDTEILGVEASPVTVSITIEPSNEGK